MKSDRDNFINLIHFQAPLLPDNDIPKLVAHLIFEFAKMIDPATIKQIGTFELNNNAHFDIGNGYLLVRLNNLHGEINFIKLANIFNSFDSEFDAHYTDVNEINYKGAPDFQKRIRCYALCLKIKTLEHYLLTIKNYPPKNFENKNITCLYRKSLIATTNSCIRNHYLLHHLENRIRKRHLNEPTYAMQYILLLWKNIVENNLNIKKLLTLSIHFYQNNMLFPIELLMQFYFLMSNNIYPEYTKNRNILFSGNSMNMVEYYLFKSLQEAAIREDNLSPTQCVIDDNMVIVKYESLSIAQYNYLSTRLEIFFDDTAHLLYKLEMFKNPYRLTTKCLDAYLTVDTKHLDWLQDRLRPPPDPEMMQYFDYC